MALDGVSAHGGPLAGWARKLLAWDTQKQPRYNRGSEAVCLQCLGHWTETVLSILGTKLCVRSEPMALRRVLFSSYWLRNCWVFSLSQTSFSLSCELWLSCYSVWLSYLDVAWTATPEVRRARTVIPTSLLGNQGGNGMIGPEDTLLAEDTWPHPVSSALCFISLPTLLPSCTACPWGNVIKELTPIGWDQKWFPLGLSSLRSFWRQYL